MKTIAAQYLEYAARASTPAQVHQRLREAFEILPLSIIILGWDLPRRLEDTVAEECARHHAELYRWHLLLASDAGFALPTEWQPVSLHGEPMPGFKSLPEFTFMCPNRTDVQEWIAERIEIAAQRGIYQGVFFDRMRWPSPAENPERHLTCFCRYCRRMASDPRVHGPAGLPFELNALSAWLRDKYNVNETEAFEIINTASGLSLSGAELDSKSLAYEIRRGRKIGITHLFAAIALVRVEGIHHPTREQVAQDLAVCRSLGVDGLVLSWDLWHIPRQYISAVGDFVME